MTRPDAVGRETGCRSFTKRGSDDLACDPAGRNTVRVPCAVALIGLGRMHDRSSERHEGLACMRLERCGSRLRVLAAVPGFGSDKRADTLPVRQLPSASSLSRYMFPLFALLQLARRCRLAETSRLSGSIQITTPDIDITPDTTTDVTRVKARPHCLASSSRRCRCPQGRVQCRAESDVSASLSPSSSVAREDGSRSSS